MDVTDLAARVQAGERLSPRDALTLYTEAPNASFFRPEPGVHLAPLSFEEYVAKETTHQPLGPVPVLYTDLLHGY